MFYAIIFCNSRTESVTKDGRVWIILETDSETLGLLTFKVIYCLWKKGVCGHRGKKQVASFRTMTKKTHTHTQKNSCLTRIFPLPSSNSFLFTSYTQHFFYSHLLDFKQRRQLLWTSFSWEVRCSLLKAFGCVCSWDFTRKCLQMTLQGAKRGEKRFKPGFERHTEWSHLLICWVHKWTVITEKSTVYRPINITVTVWD